MSGEMTQRAPWPLALEALVSGLTYRPGWTFELRDMDRDQGCSGLTFCIFVQAPDAYHPDRMMRVLHPMPVPAAAFDERSWRRWLLDQLLTVEQHEACEYFMVDGERPYAPNHSPGRDPWTITEVGSAEDAAIDFRGQRVCAQCAARMEQP